jgi:dihydropyrimidinase
MFIQKKGAIREGSDADIIIWDPSAEKTIKSETQQSVIDYNVFEGINVKGLPRFTLSRGRIAAEEGKVLASPGDGDFVSREPFSEVNKSLSKWKELTSPRKVERKAENMPAGV